MRNMLAIIPARGGSRGVPRKNIKRLQGKPLIGYTIDQAKACGNFSQIIVSTEDQEIADIALKLDAEVPFLRPQNLATDSSPTIDTVVYTVKELQRKGNQFDAVCLLQPTVPFRSAALIKAAINQFHQSEAESLVSVREVPHTYNPHWTFKADNDLLSIATGEKEIITRRQDLPKAYYRDGSVYITSTDIIVNQHSLYGQKIGFYVNEMDPDINIDDEDDWLKAEAFLKK